MNFSQEWNQVYQKKQQLSLWPWSDLVSYFYRYSGQTQKKIRVLELGCGAGANIRFFSSINAEYYATDGSSTMVNRLQEQYPQLKSQIEQADFTQSIPFDLPFDLIFDRAALTHNATQAIRTALKQVNYHLTPGGKFIGIDWFSTEHSDYKKGEAAEDLHTRKSYSEGQFAGLGRVHFSDHEHLVDLFADFDIERLEHKQIRQTLPQTNHTFASWNIVARKRV